MSTEVRDVSQDATLRQAAQLMQQWKLGSLLVTNSHSYAGIITDSALARDVVAKGLDPNINNACQNLHADAGGSH
jgi:predicted transcriptional regulator